MEPTSSTYFCSTLGETDAAADRTDIFVFNVNTYRLQPFFIVGTDGTEDNKEQILFGSMHPQTDVHGDHCRTNIKGSAFPMRDPSFLDFYQLFKAFQGGFLIQGRHTHTFGAAAHTGQVVLGTEQLQAAVRAAVALGSLKDGLAVMKDHRGRVNGKITIGDNTGVAPADSFFIVHEEHMIRKDPAKTESRLICGLLLEVL